MPPTPTERHVPMFETLHPWVWRAPLGLRGGVSPWLCAVGVCLALLPHRVVAQAEACGSLSTHYGPFDYRTDRKKLPVVEIAHFTPEVELLVRGPRSPDFSGDLSYTLHAFPNHHRALDAIARLSLRAKSPQPERLTYSVDCYFERASRFRPDDTTVRMLFADYLNKTKRAKEALVQVDYARAVAPTDNPLTQYNLGLVYFELGRYKDALAQAHLAQSLGMQRKDLMDKLKTKGQWSEPAPAPAESSPAASAASEPGR